MNRSPLRVSIVVALMIAAIGASWQVTTAASRATSAANTGSLLFEDDFNGPAGGAPSAARWEDYSTCSYNSSAAFGSIACGDNEKLDGAGHLVVPATPKSGSAIRTGDLFTFQYGTMSAWIQMPAQPGYWPAFWSLNSRADGSSELPVGEADTLEAYTTWLNVYHTTAHNYGTGGAQYDGPDNRCAEGSPVDLSAGFHKYSARIEPGQITFFFDDVQCGAVHTKAAGKPWGFGPDVTRGNWLILDLAVGGAGGQQRPATADARMLVDRVEVRALNSTSSTTATSTAPTSTAPTSTATSPAATTPAATTPAAASPTTTMAAASPTTASTTQAFTTQASTTAAAPPPAAAGSTTSSTGFSVANAAIYRLVNACGGRVLEVPASTTYTGAPLKTAVWSGRDGQRWRVTAVGSGYYKLINIGTGQAVNVANSSQSNGATVIQYLDNSGPNAEWRITPLGNGAQRLTAHHSGKALDVRGASTKAGATVDQAQPTSGCAQSWTLVPSAG